MKEERIAVLTDSCGDVPPAMARERHLYILPMKLTFNDGVYTDGVDITAAEVYRRLPEEMPKTSLPSAEDVLALFDAVRDAGYTHLFAIIFSSGLSGTYNMVRMLAEDYEDLTICVADTLSGSLGSGGIALYVSELIEAGWSYDAIKARLPHLIANTRVFFSIDTLEYLQKGGRIGKITAAAGTLLNVKPIIHFSDDGQLESLAKVRGRRKSMQKLVALAAEATRRFDHYVLMSGSGGCPEDAAFIWEQLKTACPDYTTHYDGEIDGVLGAYTGPNLVGAGVIGLEEADLI